MTAAGRGATRCPACGAAGGAPILDLAGVPVLANARFGTGDAARAAPRGDLALRHCATCDLVWNAAFDASRVAYQGDYENALHFSPRFRRYAEDLVDHLVRDHGVRDGHVVEVGCGDGGFLVDLCRAGGNRGTGFDPAHVPGRAPVPDDVDVRVHAAPFDERAAAAVDATAFVCRHVLEHLEDPSALLARARVAVGDRPDATVFLEVPNLLATLRERAVWDLIYEHVLHFTPRSLAGALARAGFAVEEVEATYGGQFVTAVARPGEANGAGGRPRVDVARLDAAAPHLAGFAESFRAFVGEWRARLDALAGRGGRAVIWGAGSKGVTFLNLLRLTPESVVAAAVDVSPRKHGAFVAGTGHPIIAPEALREIAPDEVILMNPVYAGEVRASLADLGLRTVVTSAQTAPGPPAAPAA